VATAADLGSVEALWRQAVSELDGQRGGALLAGSLLRRRPVGEMLADAVQRDDMVVVLGTADDAEVGVASAHCDRDRREPVGVIDTIYVDPAARQIGVGEAMVNLLVQWCSSQGCVGVDAPALPGSRPAKAFFETHGFVTRLLVMHHPIRPGSSPP
jgi:GNAT superfamily N-acetyltransferase